LKRRSEFKRILIVTGTPGIGKTTISERLATKLGAFHIDLAHIVKDEGITSGYDKKRKTIIADEEILTERVQQKIEQQGRDVIIDGHYATAIIPKGQITKVFVLRCHPQQLKRRMKNRGFDGSKVKENIEAEILDVCLYDAIKEAGIEKVCEIDTTDETVDETVNEIIAVLRNKRMCMTGIVDWLGKLEMENALDGYLK
jgi:adenylate kinase